MLGKYKTSSLIVILVLAGAVTILAAPVQITELGLSRDGSFTVLTIQGSGPFQSAHESVEAKEGKPFRIVIDCLASRHALPQKQFSNLPQSMVQSIRTSQYSVKPEEVVRVVLDLKAESIYRVETEGNRMRVLVSDQKTTPFAQWASRSVKPRVQVQTPAVQAKAEPVQKPKAEMPGLEKKPVAKAKPSQPKPTTSAAKPSVVAHKEKKETPIPPPITDYVKLPAPTGNESYGPIMATTAKPEQEQTEFKKESKPEVKAPAPKPSTTVAKAPVETAEAQAKPTSSSKPAVKKDLAKDTIAKSKVFAAISPETVRVPEPGVTSEKKKSDKKDVHKAAPVKSEPTKKDKKVILASTDKADQKPAVQDNKNKEGVDKIRTSKYRRESAKSAEFKATQVVQFPQRMVIKYRKGNSRDPFESLIQTSDDKKQGNFDLSRVPNVETLNLVGILEPVQGRGAALMEDRDGIGYILRPGDKVKNGYVAQVDDYSVYFQINEYGWGRTVVKHMEKEK